MTFKSQADNKADDNCCDWQFKGQRFIMMDYFAAVKFGRMSKKQREKVEDEANLLKRAGMNGYGVIPPREHSLSPNNNSYIT